ncbi:hypothetical protein ACHAQH_007102 [Verticillium albo-atrum]
MSMDRRHDEAPPPYPGHPSEQHQHQGAQHTHTPPSEPAPAYEALIDRPSYRRPTRENDSRKQVQSRAHAPSTLEASSSSAPSSSAPSSSAPSSSAPSSSAPSSSAPSSSAPSSSPAAASSSRNPITYFMDKKREREATKKVDFYEKHYGFVPKNVLTEADWKRIRKNAPKVKVPAKTQITKGYFYW